MPNRRALYIAEAYEAAKVESGRRTDVHGGGRIDTAVAIGREILSMGMRGMVQGEIAFQDVAVSAGDVVGGEDGGRGEPRRARCRPDHGHPGAHDRVLGHLRGRVLGLEPTTAPASASARPAGEAMR